MIKIHNDFTIKVAVGEKGVFVCTQNKRGLIESDKTEFYEKNKDAKKAILEWVEDLDL